MIQIKSKGVPSASGVKEVRFEALGVGLNGVD
jgi:hypothetical protein